ncbi:hypothetical protein Q1695_002373 [Nippostrongylus brasiliensis]|nr:hypothetical protein Q1695_002373 [Nippostrongylus brasiliensis]
MVRQFICLSLLLYSSFPTALSQQSSSVSVKGKLLCGEYPAVRTVVRLWSSTRVKEEEVAAAILAQDYSDADGNFKMVANFDSKKNLQPVLSIHHDCDDTKKAGRRKLNFIVPSSYVKSSDEPQSTFDLGVFNLETHIKEDEERVEEVTRKRRRYATGHRAEKHRRNHTSSPELNESPEDRIEPW